MLLNGKQMPHNGSIMPKLVFSLFLISLQYKPNLKKILKSN